MGVQAQPGFQYNSFIKLRRFQAFINKMKQVTVLLLLSILVATNAQIRASTTLAAQSADSTSNNLRPFCPWGCEWHWIFAVDKSGSMTSTVSFGGTRWNKAKTLLNLIASFLAGPFGFHRMTVYTFNERASLPPTQYIEYANPSLWNSAVLPSPSGGTDFGQPLIRGIQFILLHRNVNTCFVMITDGQAAYPSFQVQLFQQTKNYMTGTLGRRFCVICYFIRGDFGSVPSIYTSLCNNLGAGVVSQFRTTDGSSQSSQNVFEASADNFDTEILENFKSTFQSVTN